MAKEGRAIALSAGGLFAVYQAGVYKALWPYWKPDLVVGASAGALNAWLIAAGLTPDELVAEWFHPESEGAVTVRPVPSLRKGYFDPQPLLVKARRIVREYPLRLPLAIVSIEVPRFRPRMFRDHEITAEHLVATCSIPVLYPMVRLNGYRLVDGGLFEPTPVWAAAALGATEVIAIDCLPRLAPWPVGAVLRRLHRMRKMPVPPEVAVSWVKPSEGLGGARDAMTWNRGNIERWLDLGIKDGEEFLRANGHPPSTGRRS